MVHRKISHMRLVEGEDDDDDSEDDDSEEDDYESDDEATSSGTDGATVVVEGRKKKSASNLGQVVATCVVSSFTESNLHPTQQALVPAILIDLRGYQVCLYDCVLDILLISTTKSLSGKKGVLSYCQEVQCYYCG